LYDYFCRLRKILTDIKKNKIYWLWCQFVEADMQHLENIKSKINDTFSGIDFEIHLTLIGPFFNINNEKIFEIEKLAKGIKPISVELIKYSYSDYKYTSLFIDVYKSKSLIKLREVFIGAIPSYVKYNKSYNPHISLFYGLTNAENKIKLISQLPQINKRVKINKICVVDVEEELDKWTIIHSIKLL
jgi:hypothetical protein